jgi:hypothetical protein
MKKILATALVLLAIACNMSSKETPKTEVTTAKHDYGATAAYSSDFGLGDPALGNKVVALWKDFDANTLDSVGSYFADSVYQEMPGYMGMMSRDSATAMAKAYRKQLTTCNTQIDAIIPVKASEKDESLVCIWGRETAEAGGKKMLRDIHEVWGFNKDGKVTWIKQYELKK